MLKEEIILLEQSLREDASRALRLAMEATGRMAEEVLLTRAKALAYAADSIAEILRRHHATG